MSAVEHGSSLAWWVYLGEMVCPVLTLMSIGADYLGKNYTHVVKNETETAPTLPSLLATALAVFAMLVGIGFAVGAGIETKKVLNDYAIELWLVAMVLIVVPPGALCVAISRKKAWPRLSDAIARRVGSHEPGIRRFLHLWSLPFASLVCLIEFGLFTYASLHP